VSLKRLTTSNTVGAASSPSSTVSSLDSPRMSPVHPVLGDTARMLRVPPALGDTARMSRVPPVFSDTARMSPVHPALGDTARMSRVPPALGDTARMSRVPPILSHTPPCTVPSASSSKGKLVQRASDERAVAPSAWNRYTYTKLSELLEPEKKFNAYGVIHTITKVNWFGMYCVQLVNDMAVWFECGTAGNLIQGDRIAQLIQQACSGFDVQGSGVQLLGRPHMFLLQSIHIASCLMVLVALPPKVRWAGRESAARCYRMPGLPKLGTLEAILTLVYLSN
jgi:hypothetical protein